MQQKAPERHGEQIGVIRTQGIRIKKRRERVRKQDCYHNLKLDWR